MKNVEPETDYSIVSYLVQHQFHVLGDLKFTTLQEGHCRDALLACEPSATL